MPGADLVERGAHVMTVCNACRYCEQYCPVCPAMEQRVTFTAGDLSYLANLCHNCGECLYACQYAPPHEFGINVPQTLGALRLHSYEDYCWPRGLAGAFRRNSLATSLSLAAALTALMLAAVLLLNPGTVTSADRGADFYAVVPHGVLVTLFGSVFAFVLLALGIGLRRFKNQAWPDFTKVEKSGQASIRALRDVLTLRHLHGGGVDCTTAEDDRHPWRRWFHHCTFYGFLLCFASTSVAAAYHQFFGWEAPYAYSSAPVVLGTIGGFGLTIGSAGLLAIRPRRDPALGVRANDALDDGFAVLLLLTSVTGLVLLFARHQPAMPLLLVVHLGSVLALFLTLPYGKFVHGIYRAAALVKFAREQAAENAKGSRVS